MPDRTAECQNNEVRIPSDAIHLAREQHSSDSLTTRCVAPPAARSNAPKCPRAGAICLARGTFPLSRTAICLARGTSSPKPAVSDLFPQRHNAVSGEGILRHVPLARQMPLRRTPNLPLATEKALLTEGFLITISIRVPHQRSVYKLTTSQTRCARQLP